jgi:hypothetical protein
MEPAVFAAFIGAARLKASKAGAPRAAIYKLTPGEFQNEVVGASLTGSARYNALYITGAHVLVRYSEPDGGAAGTVRMSGSFGI